MTKPLPARNSAVRCEPALFHCSSGLRSDPGKQRAPSCSPRCPHGLPAGTALGLSLLPTLLSPHIFFQPRVYPNDPRCWQLGAHRPQKWVTAAPSLPFQLFQRKEGSLSLTPSIPITASPQPSSLPQLPHQIPSAAGSTLQSHAVVWVAQPPPDQERGHSAHCHTAQSMGFSSS